MKKKSIVIVISFLLVSGFFVWRFIRPMNIFIVDDRFAWPIKTAQSPEVLGTLSAEDCAICHLDFYQEWQTTIHSKAWSDSYFQTDWLFDKAQHSCRLCHTPLDRQQPHKVLGYRDSDKWDPVLEDNPDFDPKLQHEGVTCAACHYRDGKIVGVFGNTNAPHPVKKLNDPNQVCVRCHIVEGDRWDTFFRFPPCGTVAEIESTLLAPQTGVSKQGNDTQTQTTTPESFITGSTGEVSIKQTRSLGCVQCHMPLLERHLVEGGVIRSTRQHLWRGGHDPQMVKKALVVEFKELTDTKKRTFVLTLTNTGTAHYLPTGTPDRHLTVTLRLLDKQGAIIEAKNFTLKRRVMWRPFIIDLWDNRLQRYQPRRYQIELPQYSASHVVEAVVRYHLLDEKRRKRISYQNKEPIAYEVFRQRIEL